MTQTLADGNRIVERTEGAVYRDGEGRTRREHTFTGMGPMPLGAAMRGRQVDHDRRCGRGRAVRPRPAGEGGPADAAVERWPAT